MSEFLRRFKEAAETEARPLREYLGDDAPVVKMADKLIAHAEKIERALRHERIATGPAAELTGWSPETLQKYARAKIDGGPLPARWERLDVTEDGGFWFIVTTIPSKLRAAS